MNEELCSMHEQLCTAERWRQNVPCTDQPDPWKPLRTALLSVGALVVLLLAVALAKGAEPVTHQADRPAEPHMVLFSDGSRPCQEFVEAFRRGELPIARLLVARYGTDGWSNHIAQLTQTIPVDPHGRTLHPNYVGPLTVLPRQPHELPVPAVWIPGSREVWIGYRDSDRTRLAAWLSQHTLRALPPLERTRRTWPSIRGQSPGSIAATTYSEAEFYDEEFDGVAVIVTMPELSDAHDDERAALAVRVDRALQELVSQMVGRNVRAYFVAHVADPQTFDQVAAVTGMSRDGPVVHVLIPERIRGLKAFLVGRVEAALEEHFLQQIRSARVNVVLERLHGGTYEAVLATVANRPGPVAGEEVPLPQSLFYLLMAWLSERSDLARRIIERLQRRKAVA
jgi:hypothetical protein